jgi:hypothetical protein
MTKKGKISKEDLKKELIEVNKAFQGLPADLPPGWLNRIKKMNKAWGSPPEERRQPLLDALKECWDLYPGARLTQLLICARVFPNCKHNSPVWNVWDEETTKKLKKFSRAMRKSRKMMEKENGGKGRK